MGIVFGIKSRAYAIKGTDALHVCFVARTPDHVGGLKSDLFTLDYRPEILL
jgi:hypothetical protein